MIGFDDLPLSKWTSPPLTTVRQPLAEMAATAVHLVLAQDRGDNDHARSIELATKLVQRAKRPCRTPDGAEAVERTAAGAGQTGTEGARARAAELGQFRQ